MQTNHTLTALLILLSAAATLPGQQTYLSKEYIRAGARAIAVENYDNLVLSTAVNVTQSNPWYVVASADINRDGIPDLVWQQYPSSGWVQVWFMQNGSGNNYGNVLLSASNVGTQSTSLKVVAAADFNGDGIPDLVLQDPGTGAVTVWFLHVSGNTITYTTQSLTGPNTWHIVAAADFNRDGIPDLVWQNPTGGAIQIWYLNASLQVASTAVVANSSSLAVATTQDFNGDGVPDLVLQAPQPSGQVQVWFMANSTSGTVLGSTVVTQSNPWSVKAAAYDSALGLPYFIWLGPTGWVQYWFENIE